MALPEEKKKPSLKRQLGLIKATSYITGGIIGVGIFIGPAPILKGAGSSIGISLTIWVFCALLGYCGAMCYAEFGTRIPKSGGTYTYIREAFGDVAGFTFLWSQVVFLRPLATLLGSLAAAEYIVSPFFYGCFHIAPPSSKFLTAVIIIGFVVAVNCYSVSWGGSIQTLAAVCKVSALVVIVISGLVHLFQGNVENFSDAWKTDGTISPQSIVLTIYVCTYAYIGWDNITTATEEISNPKRNIPLSILIGFTISTVVYLTANVAYHTILTNKEIMSGVAVAVVFCERLFGPGKYIILACIGISAGGITNTIMFTASRINFVGGRDELFPTFLSMLHIERRTPIPSIIVLAIFTLLYMCIYDVLTILGAYSFFRSCGEILAICGMFRLRRLHPATEKTFLAPTIIPVFYLLAYGCIILVAIISDPATFLPGIIITSLGVPVYWITKTTWWRRGLAVTFSDKVITVFQKLFLCDIATKIITEE
ncbi:hypothetical protein LOTGIDRAFT_157946 [Lottia gigantea]|uniref:Amino acid permease/ SLC12A domain-containing protein n=1 Tax=Lottia gigantea TaxID=225164 RepID=V4CF72_LOTGI|nr:hypothetical protein LOTGIDRAFT_157946 [Lottia gigantea]ESP00660.1 hypothetical protein LOTGIDRAFT_157946 [Lottia gigantea]